MNGSRVGPYYSKAGAAPPSNSMGRFGPMKEGIRGKVEVRNPFPWNCGPPYNLMGDGWNCGSGWALSHRHYISWVLGPTVMGT